MLCTVVPAFFTLDPQTLFIYELKVYTLFTNLSLFLPPPQAWQPLLLSVSMNLIFFFFTPHISSGVCLSLCLAYFIYHNAFKVYPCCHDGKFSSFTWPNNNPLYIHAYCMSPYPLICSGLIGSFHILVIMNNAAVNFEVQNSLWIPYFHLLPRLYSVVGLLNHMRKFYFSFLRNFHNCFPYWLNQFSFPLIVRKVPFSPHLTNACYPLSFWQ